MCVSHCYSTPASEYMCVYCHNRSQSSYTPSEKMNPTHLTASLLLVSTNNSPTFPLFPLSTISLYTHFSSTISLYTHFSLLGFLLEKKVGVNQPKRLEDARILIANTAMDTDKIKVCVCVCVWGGGELKVSKVLFSLAGIWVQSSCGLHCKGSRTGTS